MSHYQTFGAAKGDSRSVDKLAALRLPKLEGLSFLDVGCNEGFFCGFALARGANRVVGLDKSANVINAARQRFPAATFIASSWDSMPSERFDVVLLASALHYAEDQEAMVHRLMDRVTPDGTLVLEIGRAAGGQDAWVEYGRHDGVRLYATQRKINSMLNRYAYKVVGPSVDQVGDPVPRIVVHVKHKKPILLLMPSSSYTGKSTLARTLAAAGVPVRAFDLVLPQLFNQPPIGRLGEAIGAMAGRLRPTLDAGKIVQELCDQGLDAALVKFVLGGERAPLTVLDGYIPPARIDGVVQELERDGWRVWTTIAPAHTRAPQAESVPAGVVQLGGELLFMRAQNMSGHIDGVRVDDGRLLVSGWAADKHARTVATGIGVRLAGRELAAEVKPVLRADVNKLLHLGDGAKAGFSLAAQLGPDDAAALARAPSELEVLVVGTNRDVTRLTPKTGR